MQGFCGTLPPNIIMLYLTTVITTTMPPPFLAVGGTENNNKRWNCQVIRPTNCYHLIPSNRFVDGFPDPSQFEAAKCTSNATSHAVSYTCNRCSGWVHPKCSGLQTQRSTVGSRTGHTAHSDPLPLPPMPLPSQITTKAPFTILQFNANGIGNRQVELGEFLERHKLKVEVIRSSP